MARGLLKASVMTTTTASTWILGLDLGDRSRGALCFADWFAGPEHTIAVHVVEMWSRPYIHAEPSVAVQEALQRISSELHVSPPTRISVLDAGSAEEGLARASEGAAGLIIGRAARRLEETPWALGRVARRILRRLPCPVVVVPRDLAEVGPGPVILATALDGSSDAAVGFARDVAAKHGRELMVVHVNEARFSGLIDDRDPLWRRACEVYREDLVTALRAWMTRHALSGPARVVDGSVVDELQTLAVTVQAALVVVGSRRLGAAGRIFLGSTASTLAGGAACPIAVVAPA